MYRSQSSFLEIDAMNSQNVHAELGRFLIESSKSEADMLALMLLLHTHRIRFLRPVLEDRPAVEEIAAITRRHAAETAAVIWIDKADKDRSAPSYWYSQFKSKTPYEVVEDIPEDWMKEVKRVRLKLLGHPDVAAVEIEN